MNNYELSERIKKSNERLRCAGLPVAIKVKGQSFYVRFTAPAKSGNGKLGNQQVDYPVRVKATQPGALKKAENLAKEIGGKLANGSFDWKDYPNRRGSSMQSVSEFSPQQLGLNKAMHGVGWDSALGIPTIESALETFRTKYFAGKNDNPTTRASYQTNCALYFQYLPQDQPLKQEVLVETLEKCSCPNTLKRLKMCNLYQRLVRTLGMENIDVLHLRGNYSVHKNAKPIKRPGDSLIEEWYYKITDPQWRAAYAAIATYGIRPHEVAYIQGMGKDGELYLSGEITRINDKGETVVQPPKTGGRVVYPLKPEWVQLFDLDFQKFPNIEWRATNSDYGKFVNSKINQALPSRKLPFTLYSLRHAFSLRALLDYGMKDPITAKLMGHSVSVHQTTYHSAIDQRDIDKEVKRCCGSNLPVDT